MQVGSSGSSLQSQLQALENAALGQYQAGQDFSLLLQTGGNSSSNSSTSSSSSGGTSTSSSSSTSSDTSGYQLSGSFTGASVIAVGTMNPDGTMTPFSQAQVQSEEDLANNARKAAYGNALQNFMALSQAGGQIDSFTDRESFTADNGLVGGNYETSLTLKSVGGGVPSA
jgi:hypothetical protein